MPNWVEGNIRFRGECKDIKELLQNELKCIGRRPEELKSIGFDAVVKTGEYEIWVERTPHEDIIFWNAFYIKGTHKNFIDGTTISPWGEYDSKDENEVRTFVFSGFRAAWAIDAGPYVDMSRKYNVDIHIFGWEQGVGFSQEIEIIHGVLIKNNVKRYKDWGWECPLPYFGG